MKPPRPQPARSGRRGVVVGLVGWAALAPALFSASPVAFFSPEARVWLDESQVIPFRVESAATQSRAFDTSVRPPEAAEILQPAVALDKETTGFLRLRGKREGPAEIVVDGKTLPIRITRNPAATALSPRPTLISPPPGACVYGTISVGIELNAPSPDHVLSEPRLVLPDGKELVPRAQTIAGPGSARIFAFDLDADALPPGPLALQPAARDSRGQVVKGDPVTVRVIRPETASMVAGPCAERVNDPRPERFGEKPPRLSPPDARGGSWVENPSADPAWCFRETIDRPGLYQLTMRVKGDPAIGSFPSVGVVVNETGYAVTGSRLVDRDWHRIPVGTPFPLEAGEQFITARFLNDVSAGKGNDRNLYLERYELVRVSGGGGSAGGDAMMMSGGDTMMMSGGSAAESTEVQVAFTEPLAGRVAQGPLTLRAKASAGPKAPAPVVEMVVNGNTIGRQQGRDVVFGVPLSALRKGENRLRLKARTAGGVTAESVEEIVRLAAPPPSVPDRRILRFTVDDFAWDPGMAQRLEKDRPVAAFFTNGEAILTLPHPLTGTFTLRLEARGQEFNGPPVVEALLQESEGEPVPIGASGIKGEKTYALGEVDLKKGPKQIILRFANDAAVNGQGDRNWWLRAARLEEKTPGTLQAPKVTVMYPRRSPLAVGESGVVVAGAFAPDGIEWVDLVIDGQPQNLRLSDESGLGRFVLPFSARSLSPGAHTLQVRARSRNGRETTSAAVVLQAGAAWPDPATARAVHLLNRFAYGPEPEELADVLVLGEIAWLRDRIGRSWSDPGEAAAYRRAWGSYPDSLNKGQVVPRALAHLLHSPNPARNRFVLWAENHFSTWIEKADALNKWAEHVRFLELGAAPFPTLLQASASSPAMLTYLDQNRSFARRLNENYAREIMELHTVGVKAGYTQEDVTALASVLTGWTLTADAPMGGSSREMVRTFRYEPVLNAGSEKRVFGMAFPREGDLGRRQERTVAAIDMLAAHPSTAAFISRKLAEHYVSVPAPARLVDELSALFLKSGGDMAEMLVAVAGSPEFWASADQPRLATPLDFSLRLARLTGSANVGALRDFLRKSGTGLFERATPDGYPEHDAAYADSNALLQRWRFITALGQATRRLTPAATLPAAGSVWESAAQERALDLASLRLTGRPLPPTAREAGRAYLERIAPPEPERARVVSALVAQMPPASLR